MIKAYDVIIIGGGPAGMMASVAAARHGAAVLLVEKGNILGRKLMISGGGRCNVTNAKELDELIRNIPGNGRFLYSVFSTFNNQNIIEYFEGLGIQLKEEDRGRMFPVTDKAKTVRDAMANDMKRLGVHLSLNTPVDMLIYENGHLTGVKIKSGETINAKAVVVAVGGKSVPQSGSTGDGYPWAEEAGHTIVDPFPSAVGLTSNDPWIKDKSLQGLSLRNISQTLLNPKGKKVTTEEGDMIFTHFGISGPVTFRTSRYVTPTMKKFKTANLQIIINLFPDQNQENLYKKIESLFEKEPHKIARNVLKGFIPDRLIPLLLETAQIQEETTYHTLSKQKLRQLAERIQSLPINITGTLPLEQATVTAGGVNIKEINPKTMQSKLMEGLYFAGEVMDVDAHTGGYNITVAFSTGYVAGLSAAESVLQNKNLEVT